MVSSQKWQFGNDKLVSTKKWQFGNDKLVTSWKWQSDKGLNGQYYESDNPFDKEKGTWNDGYTVPLREWE